MQPATRDGYSLGIACASGAGTSAAPSSSTTNCCMSLLACVPAGTSTLPKLFACSLLVTLVVTPAVTAYINSKGHAQGRQVAGHCTCRHQRQQHCIGSGGSQHTRSLLAAAEVLLTMDVRQLISGT